MDVIFFLQDTKKELDIDYILSKIMVQTPYAKKLKNNLKIYRAEDEPALLVEFRRLEQTKDKMIKFKETYKKVRELLTHFKSLDLTLERVYNLEVLSVTELFEVKNFTLLLKKLYISINSNPEKFEDANIKEINELEILLDPDDIGINSFYIYDSYSENLREIRKSLRNLETKVQKKKKEKRLLLSENFGFKIRPNDEVMIEKHNKDIMEKVDNHFDFVYVSDTVMHRTYKIKTDEKILLILQEITDLKVEEEHEEYVIRQTITQKISGLLDEIIRNIDEIAKLDLTMAKAYFAIAYNLVKPEISEESVLIIDNGIHLQVQDSLKKDNLEFTPISMSLSRGMSCITGANMGGKTICLRLIGTLQAMAQLALFVPCDRFVFKPLNFIFLSLQDAQSIDKGLSTFGAEMVNINEVLRIADNFGLILIDELARGTNPKEGYAISKAIINYLKKKSSISVITSHFDGLADDEDVLHLQVRGLSDVNFKDLKINFDKFNSLEIIHQLMDYNLKVVNTSEEVPKDAINISRMMGVDESILKDAKNILDRKIGG